MASPTDVGQGRDRQVVGTVSLVLRFPVKSMAGERLDRVVVDGRGLVGDRTWAVRTADGGIGSGKTTRRFRAVPGLLDWRATSVDDGVPRVTSPDGETWSCDDHPAAGALSAALGQPLTLARETTVRHHDESGVHLMTTASLAQVAELVGGPLDPWRTRANFVIDTDGAGTGGGGPAVGFAEDSWTGRDLAVGPEVVLRLGPGMPRCVMLDRSPAGVPAGRKVLRALGRTHDTRLGLLVEVLRQGVAHLGDAVTLLPT